MVVDTHRFTGFRPEAIDFLADLAQNNEQAWFQALRLSTNDSLKTRWRTSSPPSPMPSLPASCHSRRTRSGPSSGSTATPGSPRTSRRTRPTSVRASRGSKGRIWMPRCRTPSTATAPISISSPATTTPAAGCGMPPGHCWSVPAGDPRRRGPGSRRPRGSAFIAEFGPVESHETLKRVRPAIRRTTRWPTCSATRTSCSGGGCRTTRSTPRAARHPVDRVRARDAGVRFLSSLDG